MVDVQPKPRGLTSLSRYHLSQVHKVQHKPRKKFSLGLNQKLEQDIECVDFWRTRHYPMHQTEQPANQPLSGFFQACSTIIHRTVRCATELSGGPAEQRLPVRQRSTAQMNSVATEVRAQKSKVTGLSGAAKRQMTPTVNNSKP
jgi:hypothetical protein